MFDLFRSLAAGEPTTTTEEIVTTSGAIADNTLKQFSWADIWTEIVKWATTTGIKILISLIVLIVCFKIINVVCKKITKRLNNKKADATLSKVLVSFTRIVLKILVVVCIIGYLGFELSAISAVIASIGVGLSLALQGTLSNFAAGVIIVVMRPFKLGDYITSNGESGTVEDIKLYYTTIVTVDNRVVYIPNNTLANNVIVNVSVKDLRRCDLVVSVSYDTNLEFAKNIIKQVCNSTDLALRQPQEPFVEVKTYESSSVDFTVRCWCNRVDYWNLYFYLVKEIKNALDENGIEIPYNQLDVHVKKD